MKLTGWTADQIDDAPAGLCDWLLQLEELEGEIGEERQAKAARRQGS